ncbi:LysR family transcriptional regulator [Thalassotalea sp. 1_MG-2023]|uniref:LysR family transcriptional regulator n=1 Tax=Thalassotalea sp. 1_MG-2023 TaxID=3062680 RepID=UPI0026E3FB11|nr:LysR family transcriptional regulator [Thalassotalea sp. 1_MG-2023]MDO6425742.1 LysR family transcriptional regulator [Thalassotalea sp. 1_MG-2023]
MSNLIQIQTFLEVAKSSSFTQASNNLALPRSTVSARIKALETRINTRLFNRNTRNVSLTNEGVDYLQVCQKALGMLVSAEEALIQDDVLSGKLKISVPVAMPKLPLAQLISSFQQIYTHLRVEIIVTDSPQDIVAENIDVAIRGRDAGDLDLIARELGKAKLGYFASPGVVEQLGKEANEESLSTQLIFAPVKKSQRFKLITQDFSLAHDLACTNQGVVILPINLCQQAVEAGLLLQFNCIPQPSELPVYLVYPNRSYVAKRVRVFIDFIISNHQAFKLI